MEIGEIYLVFRDWGRDGMEFVAAYSTKQGAKQRIKLEEQEYASFNKFKSPWPWVIEETPLKE